MESSRPVRRPLRLTSWVGVAALFISVVSMLGLVTPAYAATRPGAGVLVAGARPGTIDFANIVLTEARQVASRAHYRYGGNGPGVFDCSGYVRYVYGRLGVRLPRTAAAQRGAVRAVPASQARAGDLVFVVWAGRITHVAIYAGDGYWWEAANPRSGVGLRRMWTSHVVFGRLA
ncbi:MAG: C40 family peptidase [Actinomycetes bacterium]